MNEKYFFYAIAFSFIFVSAFVLLSFSEVKVQEDRFSQLYFNTTIVEKNNKEALKKYGIEITEDKIVIDNQVKSLGDSFFIDGKGYTLGMISKDSILLYNYTKKVDGLIFFEYTIRNQEGVDKDYSYKIFIDESNILEGNESIKANEKRVLQKEIKFSDSGKHRLSIALNTGAEIHFNFSSVKE